MCASWPFVLVLPRLHKDETLRASASDILRHSWLDGHQLRLSVIFKGTSCRTCRHQRRSHGAQSTPRHQKENASADAATWLERKGVGVQAWWLERLVVYNRQTRFAGPTRSAFPLAASGGLPGYQGSQGTRMDSRLNRIPECSTQLVSSLRPSFLSENSGLEGESFQELMPGNLAQGLPRSTKTSVELCSLASLATCQQLQLEKSAKEQR